jgi:hypothetical protein
MSDLIRDIGGEFGIDFDKKKSRVIDHFSYEPALDKTCVLNRPQAPCAPAPLRQQLYRCLLEELLPCYRVCSSAGPKPRSLLSVRRLQVPAHGGGHVGGDEEQAGAGQVRLGAAARGLQRGGPRHRRQQHPRPQGAHHCLTYGLINWAGCVVVRHREGFSDGCQGGCTLRVTPTATSYHVSTLQLGPPEPRGARAGCPPKERLLLVPC